MGSPPWNSSLGERGQALVAGVRRRGQRSGFPDPHRATVVCAGQSSEEDGSCGPSATNTDSCWRWHVLGTGEWRGASAASTSQAEGVGDQPMQRHENVGCIGCVQRREKPSSGTRETRGHWGQRPDIRLGWAETQEAWWGRLILCWGAVEGGGCGHMTRFAFCPEGFGF